MIVKILKGIAFAIAIAILLVFSFYFDEWVWSRRVQCPPCEEDVGIPVEPRAVFP